MFFSKHIQVLILLMMLFQTNFAQNSQPVIFNNEQTTKDDSMQTGFPKKFRLNENKYQDKWLGADKGLHVLGSAICTIGVTKCLQRFADTGKRSSLLFGCGITFSLGVTKEFRDVTVAKNHFSYKDLIADIIGVMIGGVIVSGK